MSLETSLPPALQPPAPLSQSVLNHARAHRQQREAEAVKLGYDALMNAEQDAMAAAAVTLENYESLAAVGLRALLWARVGEEGRTLAAPLPSGTPQSDDDRNGGYWLHYGRYIAFYLRHDWVCAAAELGEARAYARMLGDERRVQLLACELQEVKVQSGVADPQEIETELAQPMSEMRRAWHYGDHYLPARLQRGEYAVTARLAPPTHVIHYLARALTGVSIAHMAETGGPECPVARAWAAVWHGQRPERLSGITNDVLATYARLAYALWMSNDARTARHVPAYLGDTPPARRDQAAIWGTVLLQSTVHGSCPSGLLDLPRLVSEALGGLDATGDVLALLTRLTPEGLSLVACGPTPHPDALAIGLKFAAEHTPTLPETLLAAYQGRPWTAVPGRSPNCAALLRGIQAMIEVAVDEQQLGAEQVWRMVAVELWPYTPSVFQQAVAAEVAVCFSEDFVTTLRA